MTERQDHELRHGPERPGGLDLGHGLGLARQAAPRRRLTAGAAEGGRP